MFGLSRIRLAAVLVCCIVGAACRGPHEPVPVGETIILPVGAGSSTARFAVLDGESGRVLMQSAPVPGYMDAFALSPDGAVLYFTAFERTLPEKELIAMDTRSLQILWRERLSDIARRSRVGEVRLHGNYALASSPDGGRLLVADAERGGVHGIAVLDARTRDPVGFIGPLSVPPGGIVSLPAGAGGASAAIFVVGTRGSTAGASVGQLFVLDGAMLEMQDSASFGPPLNDHFGGLRQVLAAPGGRYAYVAGVDRLYRYDLVGHRIVGSTPRPSPGRLSISPDGETLYLTDPGDGRTSAGSGLLFVYDADLAQRSPISLREASSHGIGPVTNWTVVGRDGRRVYVTAGTASRGPLYGPQSAQVLIVDAAAGKLLRAVPLGAHGVAPVFVRPPD